MQTSLSFAPSDSNSVAVMPTTKPAATDTAVLSPAGAGGAGFAATLAGVSGGASNGETPPANAATGNQPSAPGKPGSSSVSASGLMFTGGGTADAAGGVAAALAGASELISGRGATSSGVGTDGNPAAAVPDESAAGDAPASTTPKKSALELGDLQAMAVAAQLLFPGAVPPASSGSAPAAGQGTGEAVAASPSMSGSRPSGGSALGRASTYVGRIALLSQPTGASLAVTSGTAGATTATSPQAGTPGSAVGSATAGEPILPSAPTTSAAPPTSGIASALGSQPANPSAAGVTDAPVDRHAPPIAGSPTASVLSAASSPSPGTIPPNSTSSDPARPGVAFPESQTTTSASNQIATDPLQVARLMSQSWSVSSGTVKIAGPAAGSTPSGGTVKKSATKSFVDPDPKGLTQYDPTLGIGVAKTVATMPAGSPLVHPNVPDQSAALGASSASPTAHPDAGTLPPPVALVSTAHRAVEAVLDVTDRFATSDQHSVNLQFSVAGADLNVRVELRGGEVRTTFRTDSAELRNALSNEWQSVTSQPNSDRSVRLAPPVFTGSAQANTSFSGDGGHRQQSNQPAPQFAQSGNSGPTLRRHSPSAAATASSVGDAGSVSRRAPAHSVHLHTLA